MTSNVAESMKQDVDDAYIESCIEKASALAKNEKGSADMEGRVRYYKIQADGHGIAIFLYPENQDIGTRNDCIVLRTEDGGNNWNVNRRMLSLTHGDGALYLVKNHVILVEYNDRLAASECFLSHDYGKSFLTMPASEVVFQSNIYPKGNFRGEILEVNEEERLVRIAWYTESPYSLQAADYQVMTAEYDFDLNLKKLNSIDTDVLTYQYVAKYYANGIFKDSDKQFLKNEDIQMRLKEIPQFIPNDKMLKYAVYEIYARKGYNFSGTIYEAYFGQRDWYKKTPKSEVREENFNEYEKANIDLLRSYEKVMVKNGGNES